VPSEIASFLSTSEKQIWDVLEEEPVLTDISYMTPWNQASWLETNLYMQNQLLRDADVMSMAHGVEIRVPFLDRGFMSLVMKIRTEIKSAGNPAKKLLIDSFKEEIPEIIWNRPKMGFSFPFREWFQSNIYKKAPDGCDMEMFHEKLTKNQLHWSQFFSMYLLHVYGRQ
jgi:asparagine synthase (glutamine-hydrolysing)